MKIKYTIKKKYSPNGHENTKDGFKKYWEMKK